VTAVHPFNQNNNLASQKIMHLTQRQHDLERLVDIKDEAMEELRSKNGQLEMTNANFYKDALKKEVEYERIYGQVSELAKNIDQKDSKINELHKRIEELLKINANSTATG
jgi:predicted RNase H-like nuclease (RuvC/YqgF family)